MGALARLGTTRFTQCRSAAYSPDGKTVAIGGRREVCLWDVTGSRLLHRLRNSNEVDASGLMFSADGRQLAVVGFGGGPVDLWDLKTLRKVQFRGEGGSGGTDRAAWGVFAPDGKTFFVANVVRCVHLDPRTGKVLRQFKFSPKAGWIRTVVFSPNGKVVATEASGGRKKEINLWDVATGGFLRRLDLEQGSVDIFRFSPDSATLAVGGHIYGDKGGDTISLWNVATGKAGGTIRTPGRTWSLAFDKHGKTLVSSHNALMSSSAGAGEQSICVWDLRSLKKPIRRYATPGINELILSPDGKTIAWRCCEETLRFLDRATGQEIKPLASHRGAIQSLKFSPSGKVVASASEDGSVRLWDSATGKQLAVLQGHSSAVNALAYSPDGKHLTSAGRDAIVVIWDTASGAKRFKLEGHGNELRAVAFAPTGDLLAAGGHGPVLLWDPRTGKKLEQLKFSATGLAFSPDGQTLIAPQAFEKHAIWFDRKTRQKRRVDLANMPTSLAVSPAGRFVAIGCDPRTAVLDASTCKVLMTLPGHYNHRGSVAFSPDGRYLASVGDGYNQPNNPQTIQVFEVLTGKEVHRFEPHDPIFAVAFSPDGQRLATGGADTTALVWDLYNLNGTGPPGPLSDAVLEQYWAALGAADPALAYSARTTLVRAPKTAVGLLSRKLRPVPATDTEKVNRLIAQLDDKTFMKRERAQQTLAELGQVAEPALRAVLRGSPSNEVRRRAEDLLGRLRPLPSTRPTQLRWVRCVEILERIDTPEARTLLERLARGNAQSELTQEVVRTLTRRQEGGGGSRKPAN